MIKTFPKGGERATKSSEHRETPSMERKESPAVEKQEMRSGVEVAMQNLADKLHPVPRKSRF